MSARHGEHERIMRVLEEAEEPLTAREILDALEDPDIDSAHRVATVLGRRADRGEVDVIRDQPYRYGCECWGRIHGLVARRRKPQPARDP